MFPLRHLCAVCRCLLSFRMLVPVMAFSTLLMSDCLGAPAPASCVKPQAIAAKLRVHPDAQTWAQLGNWYGEQNQFECAQQAFHAAVRLDPSSAQLNYLFGLSLFESQDLDNAVLPLQHSIKLDSSVIKPHLLLGSIYTRLARPADAEREWQAALEIDPTSTIALHGLSSSLTGRRDYGDVIALLQQAKLDEELALDLSAAYFYTGQLLEAIDVVTHATQSFPDSVPLANRLVNLYLDVTRTLDAEHIAEKVWQAHPDDVEVETNYLHTLVVNGDWGPAKPVGAKLLVQAPHAFSTLYFNGVLERQSGDYAAARDHLTEAIGLDPAHASARANLGMALLHLNDAAGAKEQLDKAIELGDKEPETHFALAGALRALNQPDAAREEMLRYQQAVNDNNNTILAVSKAGEAAQALDKGDAKRAAEIYREAFTAAPQNALIGYKLAMALDQAGDTDGEHAVLEQVLGIDPTIAAAQNQLGYLDSRRGDYAAAEQHFRKAVGAAPAFTQAWISLAATLGMESKFNEAQEAVASALRLEPNNQEAVQLSHDLSAAAQTRQHN